MHRAPISEIRHGDIDQGAQVWFEVLDGSRERLARSCQQGDVAAGVLGGQTRSALRFVETGALDCGGDTVTHQLEQLEVALIERSWSGPSDDADTHQPVLDGDRSEERRVG